MPVVLIFLTDLAFFIMAAIIMWQHKKKKTGKLQSTDVKNWLQSLISLLVIMGSTWIIGVLIVEVEQLIPLAYIFTIMVAFQGLWIFLAFVLFPKQVREEYCKLWRSKVNTSPTLSKYWVDSKTPQTQTVRIVQSMHLKS